MNTMLLVGSMAACFFVGPTPQYLWLGVALISAASVFSEFAYVNYNAVLPRISHPENIGKISGAGWAAGYIGGILALAVAGLVCGVRGMKERDKNYITCKVGIGISAALILGMCGIFVRGLF